MKITQVFCPSCGGKISGDLTKNSVICPYCGTQLYIDHEKNEIIINKNITISKNETKRYIDDADVIRAKNDKTRIYVFVFIILLFLVLGFICMFLGI